MTEWIIPATVERVIDGDTIVVTLDLGWHLYRASEPVRLAGINAPEIRAPEGIPARDYLRGILQPGDRVEIRSHKLDKYGRCLATVMAGRINVNAKMVSSGHAVPYMT